MKQLIVLFTFLIGTTSVYAQHTYSIGIEGGPSIRTVYGLPIEKKATLGYYAGVSFQYDFSKTFSLRSGIASELKGFRFPISTLTDQNGNKVGTVHSYGNLSYVTIPLMLRASTGKTIRYFANAGMFVGFLVKATDVFNYKGSEIPDIKNNSIDYYKTADAGIAAGLGIEIPIKEKFALSFEVRNNLGLVNIVKHPVNDFHLRTNSTNLLVGFSYKL